MSEDRLNAINTFLGTTMPYRGMWETIEARICALRQNGSYRLLSMRISLTAEEANSGITLLEHPGLDVAMWIEKVEARYLDELLLQLRDSSDLAIGRRLLSLEAFENCHWDCRRYSGRYRGYMGLDCPYVLLSTSGKSFGQVADWSKLEAQLNRYGYSNLADTSQENLGFPVGTAYSTQIAIAAPIYLNFKGVEAEDSWLKVSVESHTSVLLKDLTLSYQVRYEEEGKDKTLSRTAVFDTSDIVERGGRFQILRKEVDAERRIAEARTWLYYAGEEASVDSAWVRQEATPKESIAWRILAPLFEELHRTDVTGGHEKLRDRLCIGHIDPTLGREFEMSVSHLLGSMGFSVFFVGQPLPKRGIDVVAVCPDSGRALVVSTHVSNDIHEKLRTLLPEFNKLRNRLPDVQLTPVLFSPVSIEDILGSDKGDAKTHQVALVLNSQIEQLFSIAGSLIPTEARRRTLQLIDQLLKEQDNLL